MKSKLLVTALFLGLFIPNVVFAAWWKPTTWKIFKKTQKTEIVAEKKATTTENTVKAEQPKIQNATKSEDSEINYLKKQIEELSKKVNQTKNESIKSETPKKEIGYVTPSGVIVDEKGNVIGGKKEETIIQPIKTYSDQQISNLYSSSIVKIENEGGSGSGFVYDHSGLILTAAHVVKGYPEATVKLTTNNNSYRGTVVWEDDYNDIAVISIGNVGASNIPLGDSDLVQIGDEIIIFGHPLGLPGIVLSKGILNSKQNTGNFTYLGTDANTQPGSSGGPWFNRRGEVVGVHVAGIGPQIQGIKVNQGLNFSVPINFVKQILPYGLKNTYVTPQAASTGYTLGSTINLKKSLKFSMDLNPDLKCEELGLSFADKEICNLYKNHKSNYNWTVVED